VHTPGFNADPSLPAQSPISLGRPLNGIPQPLPAITVSEAQVVCLPLPEPYVVLWQCNVSGSSPRLFRILA
jgi:hypothetical protein